MIICKYDWEICTVIPKRTVMPNSHFGKDSQKKEWVPWSGGGAEKSGLILTQWGGSEKYLQGASGCDTDAGIIPTPAVHHLSKGSGKIALIVRFTELDPFPIKKQGKIIWWNI